MNNNNYQKNENNENLDNPTIYNQLSNFLENMKISDFQNSFIINSLMETIQWNDIGIVEKTEKIFIKVK